MAREWATVNWRFSDELRDAMNENQEIMLYMWPVQRFGKGFMELVERKALIKGADLIWWLGEVLPGLYVKNTALAKNDAMRRAKTIYLFKTMQGEIKNDAKGSAVRNKLWSLFGKRSRLKETSFHRELRKAISPGQTLIGLGGQKFAPRVVYGWQSKRGPSPVWHWTDLIELVDADAGGAKLGPMLIYNVMMRSG